MEDSENESKEMHELAPKQIGIGFFFEAANLLGLLKKFSLDDEDRKSIEFLAIALRDESLRSEGDSN